MNFFETSYGDRIAVSPEIERILYPRASNEDFFKSQIRSSFVSDSALKTTDFGKAKISHIGTDLDSYTLLIDFLDELGMLKQYKTALDIAGGEGIHAALLRGNYAEHVEVADVRDGTDPALTRKLKRALWKYRFQKIEDRLFNGGFGKHRVKRIQHLEHLNTPTFKNYYNFGFRRTPKVDRFIVGDWRKTVDRQYDFIMSFMSFWLWDHTQAIPQVAKLLKPGGVFAVVAPWCWTGRGMGGTASSLGGGFPFFEQRLTMQDQKRYYEQFKPNLAQYVETAYRFFDPHRPTIDQHVNVALQNGLMVRGTKRLYYNYSNMALTYREFFGDKIIVNPECKTGVVADLGEVLANIRRFRNDITVEDLLSKGVVFVFQKAD